MRNGRIEKDEKVKSVETVDKTSEHEGLKYFIAKKSGSLRLLEVLRLSRLHFLSKRLRTFLTALGVALGVGSIVTLVSLGIGLQNITSNQLASLDSLVTIAVSVNKDSTKQLNDDAVKELTKIPNISLVSPSNSTVAKVTIDGSTGQIMAYGIEQKALSFEGVYETAGGNFQNSNEIIISKAALKSFNITDFNSLIGKTVNLDFLIIPANSDDLSKIHEVNVQKKIVGVSNDELVASVYMPLDELNKISETQNYNSIKVKVNNRNNVEVARDAIDNLGYQTTSVVDLVKRVDKVFLITEVVLGVIGGIALIVALIGIINIMTISLLERTHEVGTMKALGGTNKDIRQIFEYEVLLFGLTGSIFGVGGAWFFGIVINWLVGYLMQSGGISGSLTIFVTPLYFAVEMVVLTVAVSLLAGVYPSKRASKLSPMEALRYE